MRKILIASALILSVAGASSAMAATKAKAHVDPKVAACTKEWKAEKKHTQTHKAFMAACTTKTS
jgi:uncharacterized protein YceK